MNPSLVGYSALIGVFLPIIVSLVKAQAWSGKLKSFIALGTSAAAAVLTTYLDGKLSAGGQLAQSFAAVYAALQTTYNGFWKPSGADGWLQQVGFTWPQPPPAVPPPPSK